MDEPFAGATWESKFMGHLIILIKILFSSVDGENAPKET